MSLALPGGTIGLLGGGQLGRMTAMAARPLGLRVIVLDPDAQCAAAGVADHVIVGAFDDVASARELGQRADVVSYEIERIAPAALAAAAEGAPLRPGAGILEIIQDRAAQKRWLESNGFPIGPWRAATNAAELREAVAAMRSPCRVKAAHGGYDGRAQMRVVSQGDAEAAWEALGGRACVVEQELQLVSECSVLVARSPAGELKVHPPARNWHEDGILVRSVLPSGLPARVTAEAVALATDLATKLGVEGVLVVECFSVEDGRLLINELAPRPHNSYHHSGVACATGQFEQYVRALAGLPLGATTLVRPVALANLLGDLWRDGKPPAFERALAVPGVKLELYGKEPRPKRKVGHLMAAGDTVEQALERLERALRAMRELA